MSEKFRYLSNSNMSSTTTTTTAANTPSANNTHTLIGAPTLISSTFNRGTTSLNAATSQLPFGHAQFQHIMEGSDALTPAAILMGGVGGSNDTEASNESAGNIIMTQLNFHVIPDESAGGVGGIGTAELNSIMNSSQISAASCDSMQMSQYVVNGNSSKPSSAASRDGKHLAAHSVAGKTCRFPKLEECAHFHYERVQLGSLLARLVDDKSELLNSSIASQSLNGDAAASAALNCNEPSSLRSFSPLNCWFIIKVIPFRSEAFLIRRSFDNMQMLDEMLHRCVYDRKISGLRDLTELEFRSEEDVEYAVAKYLERFSKIASDSLTCGSILTWLQLDNKGRRLPLADEDTMRTINTPAVGAAYGVRRYQAQATDEISIEVGDMISVIDMPSPAESIWWRGKKSHLQKSHYEVGFFPQSCVATIGDKVPRHFPMPAPLVGQLDVSPTKPVLRKHGKLIAFFRSFILSRPSRRRLKQSGIYRERVFSCDLSEHLHNSGQEIPMVLKCCAEFLEEYGIVDGIYRLSGITSNIQRLRRAFDEERIPDLGNPELKQDIHAVSSLLKMYFRELPNPLCTYQLYDNFVEAIQAKSESNERLRLMKETVLKLPPPHYRTLKYLSEHLNKISQSAERTGMTDKNLAIVWAPNLLRSPALESGGVAALRGVGVQAVVTEYLIRNCHNIFDALEDSNARLSFIATASATPSNAFTEMRLDSLTDCESLLVEQREHDQSLNCNSATVVERPKSLTGSGPKLISLEEAQVRHSRLDNFDMKQSMPINMLVSSNNAANIGSYIEVGGGPSSLPDKYHTVISVPRSWQKRKTHSWKSLFMRNQRSSGSVAAHELKTAGVNSRNEQDLTPPHYKEASQVTFAAADALIKHNSSNAAGKGPGKSLLKSDKTKSIEIFETRETGHKPLEMCVRSSSIDSLRTAGHSRSVSHDSYFDMLQSPQRGQMTTCPSRELSELGLNFDREEPEMRIFSESESLVSSPRVGKENVPPCSGVTSRRILRARPEEFSSQTNSVNPSPKKQPRLNLLLSPSSAAASGTASWSAQQQHAEAASPGDSCCGEHPSSSGDESCCKRYKLEDQLSDIQYIDCGTPEHAVANTQPMYTSVQIHAPPKNSHLSKNSLYSSSESAGPKDIKPSQLPNGGSGIKETKQGVNSRYSYPSVQLGSKRKDQECGAGRESSKERFSYPGSSKERANIKMQVEEICPKREGDRAASGVQRNVSFGSSGKPPLPKALPELLRPKNRNSYCGNPDQLNVMVLRSSCNSFKDMKTCGVEREPSCKLAITPSSPSNSPRYSLLMSETGSENSSAVTTPQYDMEPLMVNSMMSGISGVSGTSSQLQQQFLLGVDASSCAGTSRESLNSNLASHTSHFNSDKRDMNALKRELSLDLHNTNSSKMSVDQLDNKNPAAMLASSPNNSNFTDNTSQSVTPSEFGYQHLQRQSSMHSLIETEENSPAAYEEDYENTPSNIISPLSGHKATLGSPIKSTISITYNLKGGKEGNDKREGMLETSFDENTVYEQVKFFRNSVTEVNQLLSQPTTDDQPKLLDISELNENEREMQDLTEHLTEEDANANESEQTQDFTMKEQHSQNDSLEQNEDDDEEEEDLDTDEKLLYENVQLRKPKSIYENMRGEDMRSGSTVVSCTLLEEDKTAEDISEKLELDSLDSINIASEPTELTTTARKSPSNFSVKELANKFESSPVDCSAVAFDFSGRSSFTKSSTTTVPVEHKTSLTSLNGEREVAVKPIAPLKPKLNKTAQITRSLDENAFVREFGSKHLHDLGTRGSQQLPEFAENLSNRRKSFDFTRPKTLNPPKRLPGMSISEEICGKGIVEKHCNSHMLETVLDSPSSIEHDYECSELKITPTTENRISLIQNNVVLPSTNCTADLHNSNSSLLSGVKLDRERIDRIKEERRQQLTQKYHSDSFKSKSKTDLHSSSHKDEDKFPTGESLRIKSKSRGDVHSLQKDMENSKEFGRSHLSSGSESTLISSTARIRSISDEKNQNNTTETSAIASNGSASIMETGPLKSKSHSLVGAATKQHEEFSARATAQKFERKSMDFAGNGLALNRERRGESNCGLLSASRNSLNSTREKISPQFSIRDVTAMFESRSQNQQ